MVYSWIYIFQGTIILAYYLKNIIESRTTATFQNISSSYRIIILFSIMVCVCVFLFFLEGVGVSIISPGAPFCKFKLNFNINIINIYCDRR